MEFVLVFRGGDRQYTKVSVGQPNWDQSQSRHHLSPHPSLKPRCFERLSPEVRAPRSPVVGTTGVQACRSFCPFSGDAIILVSIQAPHSESRLRNDPTRSAFHINAPNPSLPFNEFGHSDSLSGAGDQRLG
mgnify:FL=1